MSHQFGRWKQVKSVGAAFPVHIGLRHRTWVSGLHQYLHVAKQSRVTAILHTYW